ncbi:hypothetical protein [Paracoccus sp. (in: a-proteobacteria)]|uniref:hypothetical protein n=1 Tax=Paracoccus sp. TaxID=267 RepID=UPI0035AD7C71
MSELLPKAGWSRETVAIGNAAVFPEEQAVWDDLSHGLFLTEAMASWRAFHQNDIETINVMPAHDSPTDVQQGLSCLWAVSGVAVSALISRESLAVEDQAVAGQDFGLGRTEDAREFATTVPKLTTGGPADRREIRIRRGRQFRQAHRPCSARTNNARKSPAAPIRSMTGRHPIIALLAASRVTEGTVSDHLGQDATGPSGLVPKPVQHGFAGSLTGFRRNTPTSLPKSRSQVAPPEHRNAS